MTDQPQQPKAPVSRKEQEEAETVYRFIIREFPTEETQDAATLEDVLDRAYYKAYVANRKTTAR